MHKLNPKQRIELNKRYIGFVFQSYHLLDDLTVAENLDVPLSYRNVKRPNGRLWWPIRWTDFISWEEGFVSEPASGGQQQLVAIARAVIASPKLILADEPTGNLHSAQGEEIMQLFAKLNKEGTTIIQVTPFGEKCAAYGHRTFNLADGWIAASLSRWPLPRILIADDQPGRP